MQSSSRPASSTPLDCSQQRCCLRRTPWLLLCLTRRGVLWLCQVHGLCTASSGPHRATHSSFRAGRARTTVRTEQETSEPAGSGRQRSAETRAASPPRCCVSALLPVQTCGRALTGATGIWCLATPATPLRAGLRCVREARATSAPSHPPSASPPASWILAAPPSTASAATARAASRTTCGGRPTWCTGRSRRRSA